MKSHWDDEFVPEFTFWDKHLRRVFARMGGDPYRPLYRFVHNEELEDAMGSMGGFPYGPGTWRNGKHYVQWMMGKMRGQEAIPYEMIINTDPSYTWMRKSNTMGFNTLIISHAACGHSHFFKNNYMFKGTDPQNVLLRFAEIDDRLQALAADPKFGIDRVEYTLDAAMVLEGYCRRFDEAKLRSEQVRERLEGIVRELQTELDAEGGEGFRAELLKKRISVAKARLARDPINKIRDLGSFFLDEKHNPGLTSEEREIIEGVFYVARYFEGQGLTKHMNEGFASWCHKKIPTDVQSCLPINYRAESMEFWTMFYKSPMAKYENPYTLSCDILWKIDRDKCPVLDEMVEADIPIFEEVDDPSTPEAKRAALYNPDDVPDSDYVMPEDPTGIPRSIDGKILRFTGKYRREMVPQQNLKPLFDVVANYRDTSFYREFLTHEMMNDLNDESMRWIEESFRAINHALGKGSWNRGVIKKMPLTIAGKMEVVELWMQLSDQAQEAHKELGTPLFPYPPIFLQWMAEILQLVGAYQANKEEFRRSMIFKLGMAAWYKPDIAVTDGGASSEGDGTLRLEHGFDALTGFLKPSWTRESLKLLERLWKRGTPIVLITKEGDVNDEGEMTNIHDYYYRVKNGEVTDGKVEPR